MIGRIYPSWIERTTSGAATYIGGTFVALLLKGSYTFDPNDVFIGDLVPASNELAGGNYTRVVPTGLEISRSGSVTAVTFAPIVFPLITASGAVAPVSMVLAKSGGTDGSSALMLQQDFEAAQEASGEDIVVTPSDPGFLIHTSSP